MFGAVYFGQVPFGAVLIYPTPVPVPADMGGGGPGRRRHARPAPYVPFGPTVADLKRAARADLADATEHDDLRLITLLLMEMGEL